MKYFVIAIFCIAAASAQYHGNAGRSSNGGYYGGQVSSSNRMSGGHQGRPVVGSGHSAATGSAIANSGSYGHSSGHRMMGRSVAVMPALGHVAVAPVFVGSHSGHRTGRSVALLPVVGHTGMGQGGYIHQGVSLHGGRHRYARSVVPLGPVVGYSSGLTSSFGHYGSVAGHGLVGHYGSVAGHGHRIVRSPVGVYGGYGGARSSGSRGGHSNAGQISSGGTFRWGVE